MNFNELLEQLNAHLEEHRNQTTSELIQLQSLLSAKLEDLHQLTAHLEHQDHIATQLAQLQTSLNTTQLSLNSTLLHYMNQLNG